MADKARRPLQYLHAEDIGTQANSTGRNLSKVFELASEWNSMILLDGESQFDSDTFVDPLICFFKRPMHLLPGALPEIVISMKQCPVSLCHLSSEKDVAQCSDDCANSRAALFHHLEYFSGIIFLTTNLLSNIDYAFLSRCHIHLRYQSLSIQSRSMLWRKFLARLQNTPSQSTQHGRQLSGQSDNSETGSVTVNLPVDGFDLLAAWNLNGREIKNVVKTAHLWCCHNNFEMTLESIEAAISVTSPFADRSVSEGDVSTSSKRPRLSP